MGNLGQFFDRALFGGSYGSVYIPGTDKRARWLVADALRIIAKKEERSMKARLCHAAGEIENGYPISKKTFGKIHKRIEKARVEFLKLAAAAQAAPASETIQDSGLP
jgi:hypothetical protein